MPLSLFSKAFLYLLSYSYVIFFLNSLYSLLCLILIGCDAGVPATHRLHGGDEGAAGGQRPQGKQDRGHERKRLYLRVC